MVLKSGASPAASGGGGGGGATFAIGAKVEVRSNDVGFKGSWYEATITRARPRRRAYDVDYLSLVDDADPSQPLRETARASLIRPRAPRLAASARYAVDELVDAYHNDGWWPGIVAAAHGEDPPGRYTICFPGSREVLEFAASEIRPHLDWRYGQWFPPQNQSGAAFGEGAHVELSGDKDNYGAVWLLATVLKVLTKNIYLVEYKKHTRDGSDELSREFVDAQYVRPVPRLTTEGIMRFALHELIEAWHCGGWMLGVVSKIVDISKYIVKLIYGGEEEIELSHSEMRRHYDWINGQWVHGPKRRGRPSLTGKKADHPLLVSSSSGEIGQTNRASLKRQMREGPKSEAQVESLPPSKLLKKVDQLWMEIDPKTPNGENEAHAAMQDFESPPIRLVVGSQHVEAGLGSQHVEAGLQENLSCDGLRVEQRLPKCNSSTELAISGEDPSNSTEKLLKTQSVNSSLSIREIGDYVLPTEWGTSKGVRGPRVSVMKRTKKLAVRERKLQDVFHVIDVRKHSNAEVKRKRGRPPKRSTKSIIGMSITCKKVQHPKRTSDEAVKNTEASEGVNRFNQGVSNDVSSGIQSLTRQDGVGVCENPPLNLDVKDVSNNVTSKGANRSNLGVSKDVSSGIRSPTDQDGTRMCENSSLALDVSDASDNNASKTKANKQAGILSGDDFIPQDGFYTDKLHEISSWLNDTAIEVEYRALPSPLKEGCAAARSDLNGSRVDETSSFGSMRGTGENEAERTSRQSGSNKNQTSNLSPSNMVLIDPTPIASSIAKTPPFVKSSLLWKSIETMEVFHIMPQEPHFRLLEQQYGREFREGMALGLMVTFANLESDVKNLDMFDSQDAFEDRLKALKQLEENGFNVQSLRSRIDELLEIRNSVGEFQSKKTMLQEQISEREYEKGQIDSAKYVVDKDIKEVEKHLARLFEKRDSLIEQEIKFEAEITELVKNVQATEEAHRCGEQQFHSVASSPW